MFMIGLITSHDDVTCKTNLNLCKIIKGQNEIVIGLITSHDDVMCKTNLNLCKIIKGQNGS